MSSCILPSEPRVEERAFRPNRLAGPVAEEDFAERAEVVESLRIRAGPGEPRGAFVKAMEECEGEGSGEGCSRSRPAPPIPVNGGRTWAGDLRSGDSEVLPLVEALGVVVML